MGGKRGERSTGGSRPTARPRRIEEDEWEQLTAERKVPAEGKGAPMNIVRRPIVEPPMMNIKDGADAGD